MFKYLLGSFFHKYLFLFIWFFFLNLSREDIKLGNQLCVFKTKRSGTNDIIMELELLPNVFLIYIFCVVKWQIGLYFNCAELVP